MLKKRYLSGLALTLMLSVMLLAACSEGESRRKLLDLQKIVKGKMYIRKKTAAPN
ncbi:hypothetical protein [Lentibacillus cibarius]|uniref:hypothetical protein n=1 Tax=Lentibacillus cibarius TaxID=2583219 RepID=UPI001F3B9E10|nr:hypothetical protein [Lentibacillus cibarius]